MDLMQARRRLLIQQSGLDTSPVIEDTGKYWNRTFGSTTDNANWCITKWYDIIDDTRYARYTTINGFIGSDSASITFQYNLSNGAKNWFYFAGTNPRRVLTQEVQYRLTNISFSIQTAEIDNSYAYIVETGQILFAGRNTIYYGHSNISELS